MSKSAVETVQRFWQLMRSNDFFSVGEVLAAEYVLEWPQSHERIVGKERFARLNAEYPAHGRWQFQINHLLGDAEHVASDVTVTDGVVVARSVAFFWVKNGLIVRQVEYWPEAMSPQSERAHLTEPLS